MAYTRVNWQNSPSTTTPINATNLNKMDKGIKDLEDSLATVATTGDYDDLIDTPNLATVATSGSYNDLSNKPTIPTKVSELTNDSGYVTTDTTYTFATGDNNGQIKVTPSGGSAQNISVKGLGNLAYRSAKTSKTTSNDDTYSTTYVNDRLDVVQLYTGSTTSATLSQSYQNFRQIVVEILQYEFSGTLNLVKNQITNSKMYMIDFSSSANNRRVGIKFTNNTTLQIVSDDTNGSSKITGVWGIGKL